MLISCKSYNDFINQKSTLIENKSQKFDLNNNQIIIPLLINNNKGEFLFDTGAMSSAIIDNDYIKQFSLTKENYYTAVKVKGATGDYIASNHFISDSISSEIILGKKNVFKHVVVESKNSNCSQKTKKQVGIIGFDIFKNAAQPILIDFENKNIIILNNNYLTDGYIKLDTKIKIGFGNKLIIPFLIDGVETKFLFDTGNNGGFLISEKSNKIIDDKKSLECEALIGTVGKVSFEKIKIYKNVSVKYKDLINIKSNVSVFPKLTTNTVGIAFIRKFNWIIDFKTGEVFIKKLKEISDDGSIFQMEKTKLKCISLKDKLIIGFKNMNYQTIYNSGDEITSVNKQKVTPENICDMQDLLNKTEDWNTLNLEVIPAVK